MSTSDLDIKGSRKLRPYSVKEYAARILWSLVRPFFILSPRFCFNWRVYLLRLFGASVGENVHIYPSAVIYLPWRLTIGDDSSIGEWALVYNLGPVTIGDRVTISHRAHVCAGTHDYKDKRMPLIRASISVESDAWLCADSFVGPGCKIGRGAIVGAAAVVTKNVGDWEVVVGNPAKKIKDRTIN